jgi:hypothetical protein
MRSRQIRSHLIRFRWMGSRWSQGALAGLGLLAALAGCKSGGGY